MRPWRRKKARRAAPEENVEIIIPEKWKLLPFLPKRFSDIHVNTNIELRNRGPDIPNLFLRDAEGNVIGKRQILPIDDVTFCCTPEERYGHILAFDLCFNKGCHKNLFNYLESYREKDFIVLVVDASFV